MNENKMPAIIPTYICDRCGKSDKKGSGIRINEEKFRLDLCPECAELLAVKIIENLLPEKARETDEYKKYEQKVNDDKKKYVPFIRIRRITGYLVGDRDSRFNNAKLAEERDRVKHSGFGE